MSARKEIPFTQDELFEMFKLDLEKGELYWKPRPRKHFNSDHRFKIWNKIWAYTAAGTKSTRIVRINGQQYPISRLIYKMVTGVLDINDDVIHVNKNYQDTRWTNLRCISQNQNRHRSDYKTKSGFKGVFWRKDIKKWQVSICNDGQKISIGSFTDYQEAVKNRKEAIKIYWNGEENV
jgi:hypothetical protein